MSKRGVHWRDFMDFPGSGQWPLAIHLFWWCATALCCLTLSVVALELTVRSPAQHWQKQLKDGRASFSSLQEEHRQRSARQVSAVPRQAALAALQFHIAPGRGLHLLLDQLQPMAARHELSLTALEPDLVVQHESSQVFDVSLQLQGEAAHSELFLGELSVLPYLFVVQHLDWQLGETPARLQLRLRVWINDKGVKSAAGPALPGQPVESAGISDNDRHERPGREEQGHKEPGLKSWQRVARLQTTDRHIELVRDHSGRLYRYDSTSGEYIPWEP